MSAIIRDIGVLTVFVAVIAAVAWYLPKLAQRKPSLVLESEDLGAKYGWLPNLMHNQWHNPTNYLHSRLIKVFPSSSPEIALVVEWFNCSSFDLTIDGVGGEVSMALIGHDPQMLGHQIALVGKPTLGMAGSCTATFYLSVADQKKMEEFRAAVDGKSPLSWKLNLTWQLSTIGYVRPFSVQQAPPEPTTLVPNRS